MHAITIGEKGALKESREEYMGRLGARKQKGGM